jgi:hypothetical protein
MEAGSGFGLDVANATARFDCNALPPWGSSVGILMGVVGSIGINTGQNIQAAGMRTLSEKDRLTPYKSKRWRVGLFVFVSFSIINFAALALAPASVLTPLESIQFVNNIVYNKVINKATVSNRMLVGVGCALCGSILSVVFGASGEGCHTIEELVGFWSSPGWWAYLGVTLSTAMVSQLLHAMYTRRLNAGLEPAHHAVVLPVAFTLSSALAGGAQMIVHSKVFSELLASLVQGDSGMFRHWLLYVEVVLVCATGIIWVFRLTDCLRLYDPLVILPLMVGSFILFGGVAGGVFFHEFDRLHEGHVGAFGWVLYISGLLLVLLGLFLIATGGVQTESEERARRVSEHGQGTHGDGFTSQRSHELSMRIEENISRRFEEISVRLSGREDSVRDDDSIGGVVGGRGRGLTPDEISRRFELHIAEEITRQLVSARGPGGGEGAATAKCVGRRLAEEAGIGGSPAATVPPVVAARGPAAAQAGAPSPSCAPEKRRRASISRQMKHQVEAAARSLQKQSDAMLHALEQQWREVSRLQQLERVPWSSATMPAPWAARSAARRLGNLRDHAWAVGSIAERTVEAVKKHIRELDRPARSSLSAVPEVDDQAGSVKELAATSAEVFAAGAHSIARTASAKLVAMQSELGVFDSTEQPSGGGPKGIGFRDAAPLEC